LRAEWCENYFSTSAKAADVTKSPRALSNRLTGNPLCDVEVQVRLSICKARLGRVIMEEVILVNENDEAIGIGEKIQTHLEGKLHRAFSIFVFNSVGQLLIQKRVENKYHSGNLWSNTCCSHPRPGESTEAAAHRRLKEEMGFDCHLKEVLYFIYQAEFDNDLTEHEYDHVFVGVYDGVPCPNPSEVSDWQWVDVESLRHDLQANSGRYTYWLRMALDKITALYPGRV
jgi:isopentenyl-diphosphate delta-isomerase